MFDDFPKLSVLRDIEALVIGELRDRLSCTAIVGCQHLLSTTGSLIASLCRVGLNPSNVFLLGKVYSTNYDVAARLRSHGCEVLEGSSARVPGSHAITLREDARRLWSIAVDRIRDDNVKHIVILDDGGAIHLEMPTTVDKEFSVVGVEQTTYGIAHHASCSARGIPVVNVATSAIKRHFETPQIIDATLKRAVPLLKGHRSIGVIGLGKIGLELAKSLRNRRRRIMAFDTNPERMQLLENQAISASIEQISSECTFMFGCTGKDCISPDAFLGKGSSVSSLASCTSGDIEFRGLLQGNVKWEKLFRGGDSRCPTLQTELPNHRFLQVFRSGYPINFDNSIESVPPDRIQLTRGLLMCGVLQACRLQDNVSARRASSSLMLSPNYQHFVLNSWRKHTVAKDRFHVDLGWIERESQGLRIEP